MLTPQACQHGIFFRATHIVASLELLHFAASPNKNCMPQSLTNVNHFITLDDAVTMTTAYRQNNNSILATTYRGQDILATCETFDRAAIDTLLAQNDAAGLRVYFGMDPNYKVHVILCAVNTSNEDMIPARSESTNEQIVEMGLRCPTTCPPSSALNS
jgi:hypothetical protein